MSENMRMVGKSSAGREYEREKEREEEERERKIWWGCRAIIRVLGVLWGVAVRAVVLLGRKWGPLVRI